MKRILSSILVITISAAAFAQTHYAQEFLHKQPPRVPDYVAFAGDTIRFDRSDYFERMDRELVSFTYMHTNTTLMLKKSERYFHVSHCDRRAEHFIYRCSGQISTITKRRWSRVKGNRCHR